MSATDGTLTFDLKDVERSVKAMQRVGLSPQKSVNKASSKAATIVKRAAKSTAPVRTGALKRGIVIKAEHNKAKGKKVRQIRMKGGNEANAVFQKPIKKPGELGGKNPKAYYPNSMEYGFLARAPGGGVRHVEGSHFMREGADQTATQARQVMIDTVMEAIEQEW